MKLLTLQNDTAFIGNDRNQKCTDTAKKKETTEAQFYHNIAFTSYTKTYLLSLILGH